MHPQLVTMLKSIELEEAEQARRYRLDQQHSLKQLKAEGLALQPLVVTRKSFGYADYPEIRFRVPYPAEMSLFRDGSAIECFFAGEAPVKGVLLEMDGQNGAFRLFAPDFPDWLEEDGMGIKLSPDTRTTGIMKEALQNLANHRTLFPLFEKLHSRQFPIASTPSDLSPATIHNPALNDSQRKAVSAICHNESICIIHGPPGTGKTTTLVEAIRQLVDSGKKVLVAAPSNAATDHLATELIKSGIRLLRVGNTGKISEALYPHTPEGALAGGPMQKEIKQLRIRAEEFRKMALKYKRHFGQAEREQRNLLFQEVKQIRVAIKRLRSYHEEKLYAEAQVIAGTPVALFDASLKNMNVDSLLIDEAGQCLEPLAWCIFPLATRWVLAGDPWQLPPTVLSQEAAKLAFHRSMLELAIDSVQPVYLLNTQYRMRASIAGFSSSYFYNNLLHTAIHLGNLHTHLSFIDTAGSGWEETESEEGGSLTNSGELRLAEALLQTENLNPETTGFISPYAGQVAAARLCLPATLRISTIDSFQGQEAETIILSLVRSNDRGQIGFLKDYRRMNVAITRAREQLFVIGDSATLCADPFYDAFVRYAQEHGAYRTVWEWDIVV